MADRPPCDENMAVSFDTGVSQQTMRENGKEESEGRATQPSSISKTDAPKKKTTFKITSVTKSSSQGAGSNDLAQDVNADSADELDETVDSHTEDPSSEIYDLSSRATDIDSQDPLLTPEESLGLVKEKPGRFKVVKIETKEPFKRGRWLCYDYLDAPEKTEPKPDEGQIGNTTHPVPNHDDPSRNPSLVGGSGSGSIRTSHVSAGAPMDGASKGEVCQPHVASQSGVGQLTNQAGQPMPNASMYSNHVAQSMPPYSMDALPYTAPPGQQVPIPYSVQGMMPGHSQAHTMPASVGQSLRAGGSAPNLPQQPPRGQTQTSQSLSGTIPYPSALPQQQPQQQQQNQPVPPGTHIPASVHSQSVPASAAPPPQSQIPGAMQIGGEYINSVPQAMGQPAQQQQQSGSSQPASGYNLVSGSAGNGIPQQNHLPLPSTPAEVPVVEPGMSDSQTLGSALKTSHSSANLSNSGPMRLEGPEVVDDSVAGLGAGLEPLQIAVGGITNANPEEDGATEDAFLEYFSLNNFGGSGLLLPPLVDDAGGSSTVAIDNKIEQAMDLVKSHLMYAVREEVEVLKEQIKELMERLTQLEYENNILRAAATPETLAKLTPAPQTAQPPPPSSSSS